MPRACPSCASVYDSNLEFCGLDGARLVDGDPISGRTLGRYRVVAPLGAGAIGAVYQAYDIEHHRDAALKILKGTVTAPHVVGRLAREAEVIAQLNHANVVRLFEFGNEGRIFFIAMELLNGPTLAEVLQTRGPLEIDRAAFLAKQIADGLAEAHRAGFVHRDLKPSNVMIIGEGKEECVKILDFGVAGVLEDDDPITKLTKTGQTVGTPLYMAPEQISNATVGPEADLYALGVILFEMIRGHPPFQGSVRDVVLKHIAEAPPPIPEAGDLAPLIHRLLRKEPKDRPSDAAAVSAMLSRAGGFELDLGETPTLRARVPMEAIPTVVIEEMPAVTQLTESPPPEPTEPASMPPVKPSPPPYGVVAGFGALFMVLLVTIYAAVRERPRPDQMRLDKAKLERMAAKAAGGGSAAHKDEALPAQKSAPDAGGPPDAGPPVAREEPPDAEVDVGAQVPPDRAEVKREKKRVPSRTAHAQGPKKREEPDGFGSPSARGGMASPDAGQEVPVSRRTGSPGATQGPARPSGSHAQVLAKLAQVESDLGSARASMPRPTVIPFEREYLDLSEQNRIGLSTADYEALGRRVDSLLERLRGALKRAR